MGQLWKAHGNYIRFGKLYLLISLQQAAHARQKSYSIDAESFSNTLKSSKWKKGFAKQGVEFRAARVFLRVIPLDKRQDLRIFLYHGLLAISVLGPVQTSNFTCAEPNN